MDTQTLTLFSQSLQQVFNSSTTHFTTLATITMSVFTVLALLAFGMASYFTNKFTKERIEKLDKDVGKKFELEKMEIKNKNDEYLNQMNKKVDKIINSLKEFELKVANDTNSLNAEVERSHYFACENSPNVAAIWALRSARDYKIASVENLTENMLSNAIESYKKVDLWFIKQHIIEIDEILEYFNEKKYQRLVTELKDIIGKKYKTEEKNNG
ncbi:MAG: hypothetical protein ABIH38_04670 [Patescibacteria group bacterium]